VNNKLLLFCVGASFGLSVIVGGCGDPNPRSVIHVGGGGVTGSSGGATGSTGGSAGMTSGSGGAPVAGSGGSTDGSGGAGQGGVPGTATGGASMVTGGAPGVAGAPGTGGTTGGAGGGPATTGKGGAAGTPPSGVSVIDDLDDGDGRIAMTAGRQGPWHAFNDTNGGNQKPSVNGPFTPEMGGANSSPYAAHTSGSNYQFGGVGFDLNNATPTAGGMDSQAYDASGYKGITFWAKGNGNLRVEFSQRSFVPTANGGSCTESCWNVYGSRAAQGTLSLTDWKQVTIPFTGLQRQDGTTKPAFDPSQLMGIAFKHEGSTFDFWIDDVEFY